MDSHKPCTTSDLDERKRRREERVRPWASTEHLEMGMLFGHFLTCFLDLLQQLLQTLRFVNLLHFIATDIETTSVLAFIVLWEMS